MTAAPRSSSFVPNDHAQIKHGGIMRKNLSQNYRRDDFLNRSHQTRSRKVFAALLWRAFPGASEREVARVAAPVLGVSERQVINWLRCDNDAGVSYVFAVIALAGVVYSIRCIIGSFT